MLIAKTRLEILQIQKLIKLVIDKNLSEIDRLCSQGIVNLINYIEPNYGKTALIKSIEQYDEDTLRHLLKLGANIHTPDSEGKTPLMYACENGCNNIVELLCQLINKEHINAVDSSSKCALAYSMKMSSKRHMRCVSVLLENGANPNISDADNMTPFLLACEKDFEFISLLLIKHGANINDSGLNMNQPLHYASRNGSLTLCYKLLQNQANPNATNSQIRTPAMMAVQNGHLNIVRLLFGLGMKFDSDVDINGENAIHLAVRHRKLNLIQDLAMRGVDPKLKNINATSPKILAKQLGVKRTRRTFARAFSAYEKWKAKFQLTDSVMQVPRMNYIDETKMKFYWVLRIYDFISSLKDSLKQSLTETCKTGEISKDGLAKFLLESMSDDIPKNIVEDILDPLVNKATNLIDIQMFFTGVVFHNILEIKVKKGKKKRRNFLKIRNYRNTKVPVCIPIRTLGSEQYQQHSSNCKQQTENNIAHPLHDDSAWYDNCEPKTKAEFANLVNSGELGEVKKLCANDSALVTLQDRYYKTPLHIAAVKGDVRTVEYLLSTKKVNINSIDNFKWTALHHAVYAGHLDVVKLLIENGAAINLTTIAGATPLLTALKTNNQQIIEFLKEHKAKIINKMNIKKELLTDVVEKYLKQSRNNEILNDQNIVIQANKKKRKVKIKKPIGEFKPIKPKPVKIEPWVKNEHQIKFEQNVLKPTIEKRTSTACVTVKLKKCDNRNIVSDVQRNNEENRTKYGWQYDFPNYRNKFQQNIDRLLDLQVKEQEEKSPKRN